ncbi:homoserine dehydrogenase [Arenimonas sp. MALMAid1274]|uniref:homoserine dehydrogenase n=1 Tax=Arenimonas sp. MALMAid1274 TaxID=3411630 RepID=UPI003BA30E30
MPRVAVAGQAATRRIALLGVGTVGRALLDRFESLADPRLALCLAANSRRRVYSESGLRASRVPASLASGEAHGGSGVLPAGFAPGDIVVDATASAELAAWHPRWLRQGLAVVSANKLGLGGPLLRQHEIRALAGDGARYGDAATVGAGLPLLRTLRELRAGGDRIGAVVGVLSGTLAWLFDGYDGRESFAARVRAAVAQGYAEPDPRVDLSGEDVRRKLLILARAAGYALEEVEVRVDTLLTPELAALPTDQVDGALEQLDASLAERASRAAADGKVLRYVARFDAAGARIGLEALAADDPLAVGRGCDNRVAIWSTRYRERPLQIQGPGAGAEVTAAALVDDLLRVVA